MNRAFFFSLTVPAAVTLYLILVRLLASNLIAIGRCPVPSGTTIGRNILTFGDNEISAWYCSPVFMMGLMSEVTQRTFWADHLYKTSVVPGTLNSPDPSGTNYTERYKFMYEWVYHGSHDHINLEYSWEWDVIDRLHTYRWDLPESNPEKHPRNVIVLGCSHGWGTGVLHKMGYRAWGIDVAERGIQLATAVRGRTCGDGDEPCFIRTSLTNIPFDNDTFDSAVSSDVLEHLMPDDVPKVVSEISRVVKHYLFLDIAAFGLNPRNRSEGDTAYYLWTHPTVGDAEWWSKQFAQAGWHAIMKRNVHKPIQPEGPIAQLTLIRNV